MRKSAAYKRKGKSHRACRELGPKNVNKRTENLELEKAGKYNIFICFGTKVDSNTGVHADVKPCFSCPEHTIDLTTLVRVLKQQIPSSAKTMEGRQKMRETNNG